MDQNRLVHSRLRVPALGFSAATLGGGDDVLDAWGSTHVMAASRLPDERAMR